MPSAAHVLPNQKKILVVDDDEFLSGIICMTLARYGYRPIVANDGVQAMEMVEQHKPDCILLDLMMPNLDGFGFLEQKGRSVLTCRIPVVVLSAKNRMADVEKAMDLGARAYVIKPFKEETLMPRLEKVLPAVFRPEPVAPEVFKPESPKPESLKIEWI